MKIEKGKLYYDTRENKVFKAQFTEETHCVHDKIAVYCPNKDDWDYVVRILNLKWEFKMDECVIYLDRHCHSSINYAKGLNYHIITIDQFKEFYPPISKEEQDPYVWGSIVISNKTEDNVQNNDPTNPTHYNQYSIQPLDYIEANGFDFCEGNVIKYVSRYKQKNGLEDLKKARVYLDKLINRYEK